MTNLLVTGCVGHLGSYLIRNLPPEFHIIGYDNLSSQKYCSLFNLPRPIEFHDKDFSEITEKDLYNVNCVIHLGAVTDAAHAKREDIQITNIDKTKKFIDRCFDVVPLFLFPSSTSIYGKSVDIVYEDDNSVINPQSFYARAKLEIENYIREKITLTRYFILRLGTIFGVSAGMRFSTAINKFCYDAVFHKKLTIWRQNFDMVRAYLGLDDLTRAILLCLKSQNLYNNTYNIVSDNVKLSNIVNYIDCQMKNGVELEFVDTPLLNQFSYEVSTKKFCKTGFVFEDNVYKAINQTLSLLQ